MSGPDGAGSAPSFSSREFRDALGLFPTGVVVVTTTDAVGRPVGITVNSFASVSLTPPLVLFSVGRTLRSFETFAAAPGFTINLLGEDQAELSNRFARAGEDKWRDVDGRPGRLGGRVIEPNLAAFDCRTHARYEGGDHLIIVGEELAIEYGTKDRPLVFFRGRYHAVDTATS